MSCSTATYRKIVWNYVLKYSETITEEKIKQMQKQIEMYLRQCGCDACRDKLYGRALEERKYKNSQTR